MRRELRRLVHEEDGMDTVEWAILGAVIAVACLFLLAGVGYHVSDMAKDIVKLF